MNKVATLLALALLMTSPVLAEDCWDIREFGNTHYCNFIYVEDCGEIYYTEYLDCQHEVNIMRYEENNDGRNFIQSIYEDKIENSFQLPLVEKLYPLTDIEIVSFILIILLAYWIIDNARRNR